MNRIHPSATISPNAVLGDNIEVGPYAYIDDNVTIGDNCKIHPHAIIYSYVKIGNGCEVFPGAVVGAIPQDLKYDGEVSYVEIGDNVTIRECATINRGTKASGKGVTYIGHDTLVMSYVHVAHDCHVGNHCILVTCMGSCQAPVGFLQAEHILVCVFLLKPFDLLADIFETCEHFYEFYIVILADRICEICRNYGLYKCSIILKLSESLQLS